MGGLGSGAPAGRDAPGLLLLPAFAAGKRGGNVNLVGSWCPSWGARHPLHTEGDREAWGYQHLPPLPQCPRAGWAAESLPCLFAFWVCPAELPVPRVLSGLILAWQEDGDALRWGAPAGLAPGAAAGGSAVGWGHPHPGREGGGMFGVSCGHRDGSSPRASVRMRSGGWLCPGTLSWGWSMPS